MGFDDPTDLTIAHALYKRFVLGDASFQYAGVRSTDCLGRRSSTDSTAISKPAVPGSITSSTTS